MFDPCWGHLFLDPWNQHTFWGRKTKILQICNISLRGYGTKIRYPSPKNMLVDDIYTYINRSNRQKTEPWIWSKNTLVYQYIFFNRWLFFYMFLFTPWLHGPSDRMKLHGAQTLAVMLLEIFDQRLRLFSSAIIGTKWSWMKTTGPNRMGTYWDIWQCVKTLYPWWTSK